MFMVVTRVIDSKAMGYTLFGIGESHNEDGHDAEEFGWVIDTRDGPHCYSTKYPGEVMEENYNGALAIAMKGTAWQYVNENRDMFREGEH